MITKFNLTKRNVMIQFTDESITFLKTVHHKLIYKFDKDFRSLKKWEFHLFEFKQITAFPKSVEKFRNKFMKLF